MAVYDRLLGLLDQSADEIADRERSSAYSQRILHADRVVIYGAGKLGQKIAAGFKAEGKSIEAFIDSNRKRWGTSIDGVEVLELRNAANRFSDCLAVVAVWNVGGTTTYEHIEPMLRHHGFAAVAPGINALRLYPDRFLPHWKIDAAAGVLTAKSEILDAFNLWSDARSRDLFVDHVEYLLSPTHVSWRNTASVEDQYFIDSIIRLSNQEAFVDCGAYDGDSGRAFLRKCHDRFKRLTCFEPDPHNFVKITGWRDSLAADVAQKVDLVEACVAAENGEVTIDPSGTTGSTIGEAGTHRVRSVRLDDALTVAPTFIKYDIEGFEPYALAGTEATIRKHRPKVAICVYHHQNHLWKLPLQLSAIAENYSFHLEQHGVGTSDTVCYALPR